MNTAIFLHNSRNAFPIVAPGFIISHVTLFNIDTMKIDIIKICVPFIFGSFLVSNFFFRSKVIYTDIFECHWFFA